MTPRTNARLAMCCRLIEGAVGAVGMVSSQIVHSVIGGGSSGRRSIPGWLAWLDVAASALLVVGLPLGLAGFVSGPITNYVWAPMAVFEVVLAGWLIGRGVRPAAT